MTRGDIKVLVADDVAAMRDFLQVLLLQAGFKVIVTSANGKPAMDLMNQLSFDFVITDWHWPSHLEGLDLLKHVRSSPELYKIPLIFVTAEDTKDRVIQAIASGVDDYLIKPVTADQVVNRIQSILQRKKGIKLESSDSGPQKTA